MTGRGGSSTDIIEAVQISKQISWVRLWLRLLTLIHYYHYLNVSPSQRSLALPCLAPSPSRSAELLTPAYTHSAAETVPFQPAPAFAGFCWVSPGTLPAQYVNNL